MSAENELARFYQPHGQISITGDDWTSERDRKAQARREAARKKAGLECQRRLEAAAVALHNYVSACNECRDGSGSERMGLSDGRFRLASDCIEYAGFLEGKYSR